jgi:AcrR family transcriptional regulator
MFTKNVKQPPGGSRPHRGRGRPPGRTAQGRETRERLYRTAIALVAEHGYNTPLREVANKAGVSVGLLYRYFPSKRAVVLAFYDELSTQYAGQAAEMPAGRWRERFLFAFKTSLAVLRPHRDILAALAPVLVGDAKEGIFAASTAFSRIRVQKVFHDAVVGASDAPGASLAPALGRLLYLVHLGVILWWLLDKSPRQRATEGLVECIEKIMPTFAVVLRLPPIRAFVRSADALFLEALFEDKK